jgi:hypothetical protein
VSLAWSHLGATRISYTNYVGSFFGAEGQWEVVGDTFVVGAAFPQDKIVVCGDLAIRSRNLSDYFILLKYPGTFEDNPDLHDERYSTECGIYSPQCGLDSVMLSWGHDEYMVSFPLFCVIWTRIEWPRSTQFARNSPPCPEPPST